MTQRPDFSPDDRTPQDPIAALRAATGQRHARLDRSMPLGDGTADGLPGRHFQHLALLEAWLQPLAAWLATTQDGPAGYCAGLQARLALLARDLDLDNPRREPRDIPDLPPLPAMATSAFRWGVAYVVEGAQLGAAALYRQVRGQLPRLPMHYLSAASASTERWGALLAALRAQVTGAEAIAQCRDGACLAFDRMLVLVSPATSGMSA